MGRRGYPAEFRRKVLDLVEAGRPVSEVAKALGVSAQSCSAPSPGRCMQPRRRKGPRLRAAKRRVAVAERPGHPAGEALQLHPHRIVRLSPDLSGRFN